MTVVIRPGACFGRIGVDFHAAFEVGAEGRAEGQDVVGGGSGTTVHVSMWCQRLWD